MMEEWEMVVARDPTDYDRHDFYVGDITCSVYTCEVGYHWHVYDTTTKGVIGWGYDINLEKAKEDGLAVLKAKLEVG